MTAEQTDPTIDTLLARHPALGYDGQGHLMFDGVSLQELARHAGTPCWIISETVLQERATRFKEAFSHYRQSVRFHFAVKSQDHKACLSSLAQLDYGADVVSGGEMERALNAGIKAENIVFSGVGKTDDELKRAVALGIAQVNIESAEELFRLNDLALSLNRTVRVALRVNPDIDAGTHAKITTGKAENKFGIAHQHVAELYGKAQNELDGIDIVGLAVHLGSQIITETPYRTGYNKLASMVQDLRRRHLKVSVLDCGGGLGISYRNEKAPEPSMLAKVIAETLPDDVTLRLEPGRWISAPSGVLLSRIIEIKKGSRQFAIIDGGMNDLVRPAMYDAWHGILPVSKAINVRPIPYDVVGPICESSDVFARNRSLPPLEKGDLITILDAGAYGSVMSSTYNSRPFAAQIMVREGQWSIIQKRQTLDEILQRELLPSWAAG
ncbi:diaminopimelate decarboxylase [Acetobacteraceae bacterium ESL0709]|nr:diaminopimelate decarboxylase [Acetobacteraceae bacterium ESL0697]MDF7677849.1 diaminopimelate decarboxylase [Acetobacteraceae bacterium ESL0709]